MIKVFREDEGRLELVKEFQADMWGEYGAYALAGGITNSGKPALIDKGGKKTRFSSYEHVKLPKRPPQRFRPATEEKKKWGLF